MATRNIPSVTPQRRITPAPTPPPSRDREGSIALRQRAATTRAATPAYTPWTGGGDSTWMGSPGDQGIVEYGVNRTRPVGGTPPVEDITPVTPRRPQLSDFAINWQDPEYNAQIASLQRALQDFETGAQQRAERYGIDYLQGVRNIGYRPAPGFVAMPNVLEASAEQAAPTASRMITGAEQISPTAGMQGMWDVEGRFDPFSAAARGTRGMRDEFAGRGTLRSSDFARSFSEFQNRLNEQLGAMETGRSRFEEDLRREIAQQRTGTEERRQAAERAAMSRAATAQMNAYLQALGAF